MLIALGFYIAIYFALKKSRLSRRLILGPTKTTQVSPATHNVEPGVGQITTKYGGTNAVTQPENGIIENQVITMFKIQFITNVVCVV